MLEVIMRPIEVVHSCSDRELWPNSTRNSLQLRQNQRHVSAKKKRIKPLCMQDILPSSGG